MDEEERCSEEEYAEAYKEWFWRHDVERQDEEMERKYEAADMKRKEMRESQL